MTWTPRIIQGGATPREAPIRWWHSECDLGETVVVTWTEHDGDAPGARLARFIVLDDGSFPGLRFVAGNRADETIVRELAEDVAKYTAYFEEESRFAPRYWSETSRNEVVR